MRLPRFARNDNAEFTTGFCQRVELNEIATVFYKNLAMTKRSPSKSSAMTERKPLKASFMTKTAITFRKSALVFLLFAFAEL